jgi:hypothetical protein
MDGAIYELRACGMPRLELIFLHSASGGGYFRRRDGGSTYLQSGLDPRPWSTNGG